MRGTSGGRRGSGLRVAAAVAAMAAAPHAASAQERVSFVETPAGHALLVVPARPDGLPAPVVVALPDAPGPDGRGRPYLDLLNALGVATVEAVDGAGDGTAAAGAPAEGRVAALVAALAADPRLDASRPGVLAFGAGAADALREPALARAPAVLLYPGCARLPPSATAGRPVLLLHGGMDRADPPGACALWAAESPDVRRHEYANATYGWDRSDGPWSDGLSLLPVAGDPGRRVWARSDPAVTEDAAARAADFFVAALAPAAASAALRGGETAPAAAAVVRHDGRAVSAPPSPASGR